MPHTVDIAPAPWRLTGHGYLLLVKCSETFGARCAEGIEGMEGNARGGFGALMFIDYGESNIGPYRELLLSPGRFAFGDFEAAGITHIWVSTDRSAINGRYNWGLPKKKAVFTSDHAGERARHSIALGDRAPVELGFAPRGPSMPVTTSWLPRSWRTLVQPWQGRLFETRIRATGRARLARLDRYTNPPDSGFPDFTTQQIVAGFAASRFTLEFPVARHLSDPRR